MQPIRSLVGIAHPDGTEYSAVPCACHGHPNHQVPQLAAALHVYHFGDLVRLSIQLLYQDWHHLDAASADQAAITGLLPPELTTEPVAARLGIGFAYTDRARTRPLDGRLDQAPTVGVRWLYLFTLDGGLAVYANDRCSTWAGHDRYLPAQMIELAHHTAHPTPPPPER